MEDIVPQSSGGDKKTKRKFIGKRRANNAAGSAVGTTAE